MHLMLRRESAEALSAAIEREAELRAALAEATARLQSSAAGAGSAGQESGACCPGQAVQSTSALNSSQLHVP